MKQLKGCLFCKIVAGEIPCTEIYRDDKVLAFFDISPINKGHILVIPLEHHTSPSTLAEEVAGRLFKVGTRLGIALKRAGFADAYNLHLADGTPAGQVIMHAHLHVVPRGIEDGFYWNWRQLNYQDDQEKLHMKDKIIESFDLKSEIEDSSIDLTIDE